MNNHICTYFKLSILRVIFSFAIPFDDVLKELQFQIHIADVTTRYNVCPHDRNEVKEHCRLILNTHTHQDPPILVQVEAFSKS